MTAPLTPPPVAAPPAAPPPAAARPMDPEQFAALAGAVEAQVRRVIVGQQALVRDVLACLFAQGHVLLEGVPGLGKTVLLRTLADALDLRFSRVQCTPDLLPSDILGTTVLSEDGSTSFAPGPVFTQLLLADEINRATPKTQSALLEAMAERRVTTAGTTRDLPRPFFVMATQNPIEMEGTYPLPEAQLDRFLAKVLVELPQPEELAEILSRTTGTAVDAAAPVADDADLLAAGALVREVPMAAHVLRHVVDLVGATQPRSGTAPEAIRRYVRHGSSPRGAQALVLLAKTYALLAGRVHVAVEDVRAAAAPCLRHRLVLGYEALAERVEADALVAAVLEAVPPPAPAVRGAT